MNWWLMLMLWSAAESSLAQLRIAPRTLRALFRQKMSDCNCWILLGDLESISMTIANLPSDIISNFYLVNFDHWSLDRLAKDSISLDEDLRCSVFVPKAEVLLNHLDTIAEHQLLKTFEWYFPDDPDVIDKLPTRLDSNIRVLRDHASWAEVVEMYSIKNQIVREIQVQIMNFSNGVEVWTNDEFIWHRRRDLSGIELSVVVENSYPAEVVEIDADGKITGFYGIFPDVFNVLQSIMNFTYTLQRSNDGSFGILNDNNEWTGMIGMLGRREVDMSPCGFSITEARSEVVDFSMPVFMEYTRLFVRKPKAAFNWLTYFDVYNITFWYAVLACFIGLALAFILLSRVGGLTLHAKSDPESFGLLNSIGLVGISFLQREYPLEKRTPSLKILVWTTYIGTFLVYTTYCATLTSTLTLEDFQPPVESLDDVYNKHYQLLVWKGTIYEDYFRSAPSGDIEAKLWVDRIKDNPKSFVESKTEAFEKVFDDDINVFFGPTLTSKGLLNGDMKSKSCDIVQLPEVYLKLKDGMAFTKNSELVQLFSYQISRLHQLGQIDKIFRKYLPERSEDCPNTAEIIGVENTIFLFATLSGGIILASILALLERFLRK